MLAGIIQIEDFIFQFHNFQKLISVNKANDKLRKLINHPFVHIDTHHIYAQKNKSLKEMNQI